MASKTYQVAKTGTMEELRRDINLILRNISEDLASMRGEGGRLVTINGDIDMRGRRIKNIGMTSDPKDVPSRQELQSTSMYETSDGHIASSKIIATRGASAPEQSSITAVDESDLVTKGNVRQLLKLYGLI